MDNTSIEWADSTWQATLGCSRISAGCTNCYAERQAVRGIHGRFRGLVKSTPRGPRWTGVVRLNEKMLDQPLRWRKPRRIFVDSLGDLFHEALPGYEIDRVYAVFALAPWHTYLVLTKRAERLEQHTNGMTTSSGAGSVAQAIHELARAWRLPDKQREAALDRVLQLPFERAFEHVHHGVSCEDQPSADKRIPHLQRARSALRFVSLEPLLGDIDLVYAAHQECTHEGGYAEPGTNAWVCSRCENRTDIGLDWGIVGGESGPGARPCDVAHVRSIVRQFASACVPLFVKQLGSNCGYTPRDRDEWFQGYSGKSAEEAGYRGVRRLKDRKGGDMAEWPADLRVRQLPEVVW